MYIQFENWASLIWPPVVADSCNSDAEGRKTAPAQYVRVEGCKP
jgi:hypothetical protein